MKKIILLPLMVLPLLTGCNNTQKEPMFSLEEWLSDITPTTPTYFEVDVYNKNTDRYIKSAYGDYEAKVADIIKENTKSMSLKKCGPLKEMSEESKSYPIRYSVDKKMNYYERLEVRISEDTLLMYAFGYDENKAYVYELTEYTLPKEDGKKLIEEVNKRYEEVDVVANESYAEVWDKTTPENFYAYIESSTTKPSVFYNGKETKDTDLSLLADIKEFVYIEVDHVFRMDNDEGVVNYGIKDDFIITIGEAWPDGDPLVQVTRYYDNPATQYDSRHRDECRRTYSVSEQKLKAFVDKVKAL